MEKKTKIIVIAISAVIILAVIFVFFRKRIEGVIMGKLKFVENQRIRNDRQGKGHYGASRSSGTREHKGIDIVTIPGEAIVAPENLKIVRRARPSTEGGLDGLLIELEDGRRYKLFYVAPVAYSGNYEKGKTIAIAQDMLSYYGPNSGMINHMHVEREDKADLTNEILL